MRLIRRLGLLFHELLPLPETLEALCGRCDHCEYRSVAIVKTVSPRIFRIPRISAWGSLVRSADSISRLGLKIIFAGRSFCAMSGANPCGSTKWMRCGVWKFCVRVRVKSYRPEKVMVASFLISGGNISGGLAEAYC